MSEESGVWENSDDRSYLTSIDIDELDESYKRDYDGSRWTESYVNQSTSALRKRVLNELGKTNGSSGVSERSLSELR